MKHDKMIEHLKEIHAQFKTDDAETISDWTLAVEQAIELAKNWRLRKPDEKLEDLLVEFEKQIRADERLKILKQVELVQHEGHPVWFKACETIMERLEVK